MIGTELEDLFCNVSIFTPSLMEIGNNQVNVKDPTFLGTFSYQPSPWKGTFFLKEFVFSFFGKSAIKIDLGN